MESELTEEIYCKKDDRKVVIEAMESSVEY